MSIKIFVFGLRGFPNVIGGVETHSQELYTRLSKYEDIQLIIFRRKPYINSSESIPKISFIDLPSTKIKGFEAIIHSFLCTIYTIFKRPDLVHIHNIGPSLFIPILKIFKIPVIVTYHSPNYLHPKWGTLSKYLLKICERIVFRFANKIIFISKHLMKKIILSKSLYIPNGISPPQIKTEHNFLDTLNIIPQKYILYVGRLSEEKGCIDIVNAYASLNDHEYQLVIAGDIKSNTSYINKILQIAKVRTSIIFTGYIYGENLAQVFSHARLFVLPSYHEGMPLALLEAISYGIPIIASDIPANRDIGIPDQYLFPPGNIKLIAERIIKTINNNLIIEKEMYLDLIDKFNWDRVAQSTHDLYISLIK